MGRIDAHQHFWHYDPAGHAWMTDAMAALRRDFLPADLEPLLRASGFDGCVAVQARQSLEETEWLLALAREHAFIRGVVGWVDLRSQELPRQLERFASDAKLVGVRHVVQDEPDDAFLLREDFQRGIEQLKAFNLAYDLLIYPRQLRAAAALVRRFPQQRFVLDHIAKPPIAAGQLSPWREVLRSLAEAPNVWCKLSGMVTEADWHGWRSGDFTPYLDVVFDCFGAGRLMIGSDWPVCTLASDYQRTVDVVLHYIEQLTPAERERVTGASCAQFYGIDA